MIDSSAEPQGYASNMLVPGQPGQPTPALVTLQPVTAPQDDPQQQMSMRMRAILAAFRRRWFVALFLGLAFSSMAAAAVWAAIPDTYTATMEMLVDPSNRFLYDPRQTGEQSVPLNTYKQTRIRLAKFPFVLTAALRNPQVAQLPTVKEQQNPVLWLEQNLQVTSPGEQFISISLTGRNPKDVAPIVNAIGDAFMQEVVDKDQKENDIRTEELKHHLAVENAELERLRRELRNIDKEIHTSSAEQADKRMEASFLLQVQLRQNLAQAQFEIIRTRAQLERAIQEAEKNKALAGEQTDQSPDGEAADPLDEIPAPEPTQDVIELALQQDEEYVRFDEKLRNEERQLKLWEARVRQDDPRLAARRESIETLKRDQQAYRTEQIPLLVEDLKRRWREDQQARFAEAASTLVRGPGGTLVPATPPVLDPVTALRNSLADWEAQRASFEKELDAIRIKTDDFSTRWIDRQLKAEELERIKARTQLLEDRVEARETERAHFVSPIQVVRKAEEPKQADVGKRVKLAGAAGFGLFALVVAGVVLLEYSAHRLNSVSEVQSDLNLQVMSTIPLMPRWVNSEGGNSRNKRSEYWHSVLTESVDATRTLLLRHATVSSTKAVMIASATGGEGKTTLACHLATSLVRAGREVLLIDGDIRRPSVHKVFDLKNRPGLCEVLTGQIELPDALHPVNPHGLSVLTAGRVDADALRVLAQDKLGQLMEIAREQFDFIIVDTSPILPVTDALLMSQFMDGVLFSVRRDVSRAAKVAAAVQRVSMLGVNVLGAVAIGLDEGPSKTRYSYYHYGYGYGYGPNPYAPPMAPSRQG